jgi:hypothetical protein
LVINAVPAAEAGAPESTRDPPTQNLSSEQLERSELSPNHQAHSAIPASDTDPAPKLFSAGEAGSLRSRWESIQVEFVDEPKRSVKEADQLVAAVIGHLAEGFTTERHGIESQWDRSDDISTKILDVHSVAIARPLNACSPFSRTGLCETPRL